MATKFYPIRAIFVPATGGHPPKTEYRVANGQEEWDQLVLIDKCQMVYGGKINGRIAPSFPVDTNDRAAVELAYKLVDKNIGTNSQYEKHVVVVSELKDDQTSDELSEEMEDYIHDFYLELAPAMTVVSTEYQQTFPLGDGKYGFLFVVYYHDPRTRLLKGSIRTSEDFHRAFSTGAKVEVLNKENDKSLVVGEIESFGGNSDSPDPIIKGVLYSKKEYRFRFW